MDGREFRADAAATLRAVNILLWRKHHEQAVAQAQKLAECARDVLDVDDENVYGSLNRGTAVGDFRKLRGLPAIARGVSDAIPGTQPGSNLR